MQIIAINDLIQLYRENYSDILKSALGRGDLSHFIWSKRKEALVDFEASLDVEYNHTLTNLILSKKTFSLNSSVYQSVRSKRAPILIQPEIFQNRTCDHASAMLLKHFGGSTIFGLLEEILFNSQFTPNDLRYRSDWENGKIIILGEDSNNFLALSGIAHELGHCIAERLSCLDDYSKQIISEAYAQTLEELMLYSLLPGEEEKFIWFNYQREIDSLNYYFYLLEISKLEKFSYVRQHIDLNFFDLNLLLLRQTFFTNIGYQSIYARASLIREKILNRYHCLNLFPSQSHS